MVEPESDTLTRKSDDATAEVDERPGGRRGRIVFSKGVRRADVSESSTDRSGLVSDAEQLRLLTDVLDDCAIIALDPSGRITSWNDGARRVKGYQARDDLGRHFALFYMLADITRGKAQDELAVARDAGRFDEEAWRVRKGGAQFWAHITLTAVHDDVGGLRGFMKVTRDLTVRERARAAEALVRETRSLLETADQARQDGQAADQRLRTVIDSMSDGYCTLDEQWRFASVNASLARLLDKSGQELIGASFWDEVTDSVHSNFFKHLPSLLTGTPEVSFTEFHAPTARWFYVSATWTAGRIAVLLRHVSTEHERGQDRGS